MKTRSLFGGLCATAMLSGLAQADLIINEIVDGTLPGGLPKWVELANTGAGTVDLTAFEIANYNNGSTTPGGGAGAQLTGGPLAAGGHYIIAYEYSSTASTFSSVYGSTPDLFIGPFINGDDAVALQNFGPATVADVYGVIGEDGTGKVWEYTDGYSFRCGTSASATFDATDWCIGGANSLETGNDPEELALLLALTTPGAATMNGNAMNYCTAGTSLGGCNGAMSVSGTPSVSAGSGCTLSAGSIDGQRSGIMFFGANGPAAKPWGSAGTSLLCVQGPVQRTGLLNSGGTGGACDGALSLDFNTWMLNRPAKAPAPGSQVWAQGWYRDPGAPKNSNLSDGVVFFVCP